MSDIDLIPSDYRRRLVRLRQFKVHGWVAAVLLLACAGAWAGLDRAQRELRGEVARLQREKSITEAQRAELERLHAERQRLGEEVRLQAGLTGGVTAQHTFLVVDRALAEGQVWFDRWVFDRSGKAQPKPAEAVETGYLLVIPAGEGRAASEAWRIDSHMTIEGQARDHATLSGFVGRLLEQPEVDAAHLLNSTLQPAAAGGQVKFKLLVGIDMEGRG